MSDNLISEKLFWESKLASKIKIRFDESMDIHFGSFKLNDGRSVYVHYYSEDGFMAICVDKKSNENLPPFELTQIVDQIKQILKMEKVIKKATGNQRCSKWVFGIVGNEKNFKKRIDVFIR